MRGEELDGRFAIRTGAGLDQPSTTPGSMAPRPSHPHPNTMSAPDSTDGDSDSDPESEAYAEGTALTKLLGEGPKVKILAAFLAEPDLDHNVTDVARLAGVTRKTVYSHLDDLLELGVVEQTRETGGSPRYKIDTDDAAAKKLAELEWELVDRAFGE